MIEVKANWLKYTLAALEILCFSIHIRATQWIEKQDRLKIETKCATNYNYIWCMFYGDCRFFVDVFFTLYMFQSLHLIESSEIKDL